MPAGDLGIGILHIACRPAGHLRHIVGQAAIRDVAGDGTGDLGWAAGHWGYRLCGEGRAIACGHTAKGAAHKAHAAACSHAGASINHCVTDKAVGLIPAGKSWEDAACCAACRCAGSAARSGAGFPRTAEHGRRTPAALGKTGEDPGCHHHLNAHAAAGLSDGKAEGS